MNMKMNRSIRKLVAGSLVCAMAAGATPFTNVNPYAFTKVQAASEVLEEEELYLQKEISGNIWWGWEGSMWVYKDYGTKVKVVSTSEEIGKISCTFESSDPSVFKVDKDGVITPVSMGVAQLIVHAKTEDGKKQTKVQNVRIVDHFECGGMAYAPIGENEIKFLSALYEGKKDQGRICIPHMINADVMKVVGAESCAGFKNVKFIEVPDSVTTIEDRAFADNDSLEFVMIPKSVTKIADNAFDRENISDDKIIIKGYKGTEAEKFAKDHEDIVTFEAIEGEYVPYKLLYSIKFEGCNGYKTLEVGEEYQFIVKADPIDTDEEITFTSEDESIVSVTSAGAVTAKKPGYTKIIATSTTGIENAVYVNVNAPLETTEPTATPVITTTPTVTPTVKVTATPVVTPTAKVTTAPTVTTTAKVTATPVVTPTAKVTTAPAVTVTPVVTPTTKVTTAPAITPTAKVTATPVVTPTAEVTTTPGLDLATPTSSVTPVATPDETASADVSESDSTADTASSEEETTADIVDVINSILETPLTDDKKVVSQTSNKTTTKAKKASLSILTNKNKKFVAGKKYTLKAQKKNTDKKLKWSVSNKKIATINENTGVLKAKKAGKVTITVTCGDLKKKITITVHR